MTRMQRTKETLQKASEHLYYEYWMFNSLARAITSGVFGRGPLNNAVLEAFGVHARVIAKFIYDSNPRPDDITASDFTNDKPKWEKTRPSPTESISSLYARVGKELAHLSYARLDVAPDSREWPIVKIADEINHAFLQFLSNADSENLAQPWETLLQSIGNRNIDSAKGHPSEDNEKVPK